MTQGYSSDKQIIRDDQVGSHQTNDKRWASKVHSYSKKGVTRAGIGSFD